MDVHKNIINTYMYVKLCIIITYRIAGLFSGLKFLLFKFSLELILVVYKIFVNIYLTLIKFSGINFSGFEPARKLIPHKINQLYGTIIFVYIITFLSILLLGCIN